jgi:hypothetical protein
MDGGSGKTPAQPTHPGTNEEPDLLHADDLLPLPGWHRPRLVFEKGVFTDISVREEPWPEVEFVISGDYETFAKISRAEMGSRSALMSGKLRLKGNMVKALSLASIVDRFNKILSEIPCEY